MDTKSEEEVTRDESSRDRFFKLFPTLDTIWIEHDRSIQRKVGWHHLIGINIENNVSLGTIHPRVGGDDGFGRTRQRHHLDELHIPILSKPMMAVELHRVLLTLPKLLNLAACPAEAQTLVERHVDDTKPRIIGKLFHGFGLISLPADAERQPLRILTLGDTVSYRGKQFGISVRCDLNKYRITTII